MSALSHTPIVLDICHAGGAQPKSVDDRAQVVFDGCEG
jgi:hypothetical protein